jgi:hypothetical protein
MMECEICGAEVKEQPVKIVDSRKDWTEMEISPTTSLCFCGNPLPMSEMCA